MNIALLNTEPKQNTKLERTADHIHIQFYSPARVLSSAVLNGGLVEADHLVNLKVPKNSEIEEMETPAITLEKYCRKNNWQGTAVGMMTAASMDSIRIARHVEQNVETMALVTAGLSNPRRAGDDADWRIIASPVKEIGTINTMVLTSAILSPAAMAEALMIATEAKVIALQSKHILSPVSNQPATGTGTDSIAIVSGQGPVEVDYCGKHVLLGEIIAKLVIEAITSSISWESDSHSNQGC